MSYKINAAELRAALADIERAEANGFMHCLAVFDPVSTENRAFVHLNYSDLNERAHPTDGNLNWGRFQGVTRRNKFKNGKLIPLKGSD